MGVPSNVPGSVPLASGASESLHDVFVSSCDDSSEALCPMQADLHVNVAYSDGASFSIPQTISVNYDASANLFASNTGSSYCSGLLSSISPSSIQVSYSQSFLYIANRGNSAIGIAAYVISDPLNPSGLHAQGIPLNPLGGPPDGSLVVPPTANGGVGTSLYVGSQSFISGKQYSLWLQLGEPANVVYAQGSFCTLSLTLVP
jgi:hypothetical protein